MLGHQQNQYLEVNNSPFITKWEIKYIDHTTDR
jgi:hypothetical protein